MRGVLLLLVWCLHFLVASEDGLPWIGHGLRVEEAHPLVREGLLYRLTVRGEGEDGHLVFPARLELRLSYQESVLATATVAIDDVRQWRRGIAVYLVAPQQLPPHPLRLFVVLDDDTGVVRARLERSVEGVAGVSRQIDAFLSLRQHSDPLPGLWLEQAALILHRSRRLDDSQALLRLRDRLAAFPASAAELRRQDGHEDAYRARSDGSFQPYRLHRPPSPSDRPALLLWLVGGEEPPAKNRWPAADPTALQAAVAAGFTVVEVYPAGDPAWRGIASRRIAQALAAVRERWPALAEAGVWVYASGAAVSAARALALPWRGLLAHTQGDDGGDDWAADAQGVAVITTGGRADWSTIPATIPRFPGLTAEAWAWLRDQRRPARPRVAAAVDYADGPFVVVVGTGEHAAAAERNRHNARRFLRAWIEHSQGEPTILSDTEALAQGRTDRHLVCFGNPRSNALLGHLFGERGTVPLVWDERDLRYPAGEQRWLRDASTAVVILPHPRHRDRLVIICDGADIGSLLGEGLPLLGLPPLTILGADGRPVVLP